VSSIEGAIVQHGHITAPTGAHRANSRGRTRPTGVQWAALAMTGLFLSGCASSTGFSDLEREPSQEDSLPSSLPDYAFADIEAGTVRFVDVVGDHHVYLAKGKDLPVCLLIYTDDADWFASCGSSMLTVSGNSVEAIVVDDSMPAKDGWTRIGRNVLIKD
jgi:hypothetical protein